MKILYHYLFLSLNLFPGDELLKAEGTRTIIVFLTCFCFSFILSLVQSQTDSQSYSHGKFNFVTIQLHSTRFAKISIDFAF